MQRKSHVHVNEWTNACPKDSLKEALVEVLGSCYSEDGALTSLQSILTVFQSLFSPASRTN